MIPTGPEDLALHGWARTAVGLPPGDMTALRETAFREGTAGTRCLLDFPTVRNAAVSLRSGLISSGFLSPAAAAIQAIAFDKTPETNWKVAWHQDLMFPFARPVTAEGFDLPTVKDGIPYARPPREVLEELLAVRLHLDDCDESNGPLRVRPGTHACGIIPSHETAGHTGIHGEIACLARRGEAILMKPLLLHASSQAAEPGHRRVLHIVYHSGRPMPETWHRQV